MLHIGEKLKQREAAGKTIGVGIVGAGQMGKGMAAQIHLVHGMKPVIVADHTLEKAVDAYRYAGINDEAIARAKTRDEANRFAEQGKFVATDNPDLVSEINAVECVVDCTGRPESGAIIAPLSIENGKHIVMMDVEADVCIGPYLKKLAKEQGVIYTGTAGDEPGAVMELYNFAATIGLDVKVIGKGKNNKIDYSCNPDTVYEEATRRKMSPHMLSSFKDGTKTMVEMTAMSNATGYVPDVVGAHGPKASPADHCREVNEVFRLKKDGGILSKHGVVDYVDGLAPGVFVVVAAKIEEAAFEMDYLAMGSGPLWTLYRPYHLCNLETPLTIAKAVIDREPTIVPIDGTISECITVAKKDMRAGEFLDGIGGYTTYGSICEAKEAHAAGYVIYGLVNNKARLTADVKKGELLTMDKVTLDTTTDLYKIRRKQDEMYGVERK